MNLKNFLVLAVIVFLSLTKTTNAHPIEFFSSNNTSEITLKSAYERLTSNDQQRLHDAISDVLKKNHIQQGKTEDLLGAYMMADDRNVTADNTEVVSVLQKQKFPKESVFAVAKELAVKLRQESVAVFIPTTQHKVGEVMVSFAGHPMSVNKTVELLQKKLPAVYNHAYSLHLQQGASDFEHTKVLAVEWLGSQVKLAELEKVFVNDKISQVNGDAYLIYKNGNQVKI